jgi:hypothetical protein
MASISSSTPDIVVNAVRNADDKNVINFLLEKKFVIENEHYLKKLKVGAHVIKVQSSPVLNDLYNNYCLPPVSYGNYVILFNLTHESDYDVKVILFNYAVETLNLENNVFSIRILKKIQAISNKSNELINKIQNYVDVNESTTTTMPTKPLNYVEQHVDEGDLGTTVEDETFAAAKRQKLDGV